MTEQELNRLKESNPLAFAVKMYKLNPIDHWKDKIKSLYFEIPEDERRFCMGDMDLKDFEIKSILEIK